MATDIMDTGLETIGLAAGRIWHLLNDQGPLPISKLVKELDFTRDVIMQGLGWLAREDKIQFTEGPRSRLVALK